MPLSATTTTLMNSTTVRASLKSDKVQSPLQRYSNAGNLNSQWEISSLPSSRCKIVSAPSSHLETHFKKGKKETEFDTAEEEEETGRN